MTVKVIYATGRATCKICKEKIAKDDISIHFKFGMGISAHHHFSCIEKKVKELKENGK